MSERSAFVLSLDRKLHSDLLLVALCPTQDLIACWSRDPLFSLSCYRLNWQKVWTHSPTESQSEPTALCWHPEAGLLATGFADGYLSIVDTERGEVRSKVKTGKDAITSLSWLEEDCRAQQSKDHNIMTGTRIGLRVLTCISMILLCGLCLGPALIFVDLLLII